MKTINHKIALWLSVILMSFPLLVNSQNSQEYELEKIYSHTDRPFYFPGETIWFKSYIVGCDNTISTLNDIMYAELISPSGNTVKTIKLSINQGYAYGDFAIDKDWIGGIYSLKMYTNWMKNFGENIFFTKKITIQKIVKPNVLLSLEFEREGYGKSSEVTAKFDAKDLKNNPLSSTKISYKVSAKGKNILSKKMMTDSKGKANIKFQLPNDLNTRDVVLNVLIQHKGSRESISRSVPVVLDNIDLQFFPESGKILSEIKSNVAFKAINEFGKPVDIQGDIIDNNGVLITSFKSFHDGMGAFELKPNVNEKYYAKITSPFVSDRKIPLPETNKNGVNFNVKSDGSNTILQIHSTYKKPLFLEVKNSNKLLFKEKIKSIKNEITINSSEFPIGITNFIILDKNNIPLAERLVFINSQKQLNIDIQLDKEVYKTREKVKVTITTKDKNNNPIPSNLSVAIADNKLISFADDKQDHILSYLLLSSELKGKIHKPSFYFNSEEKKSYLALDYIMLTNGWRNYIHKSIDIDKAKYKPEQRAIQYGKITDKKGNPVKAKLLLFNQKGNNVLSFESDNNGEFFFKFDKRQSLTLIAYTDDGRKLNIVESNKRNVNYNNVSNYNSRKSKGNFDKETSVSKFNKPTNRKIKQKAIASVVLTESAECLEEIVIVAYESVAKRYLTGSSIEVIDTEINSTNESLGQLLQGQVAGISIVENSGIYGSSSNIVIRGSSSISGNNQPLIIVDGVPYRQDILSEINTNEIDAVTVLKDAAATSLYGSRGSNGVIIVSTKNQNYYSNWRKKKLNNAKYNNYAAKIFYNYKPQGLYYSKQFYIPKYEGTKLPEKRTDFRQTIYWNPVVQTDKNGKAELEFYNSDAITSFKITTEGIGFNGLLGKQEKKYATKKLLNIDFKMPNYMVLNDTIILPFTITNESDDKIISKLDVNIPSYFKIAEEFDSNLIIEANSSTVRNIKIIPLKKINQIAIEARIKSDGYSDSVKRKTSILSPYFPTEVSVSGLKSQSFEFSIDNIVEGSVDADFIIYTDIVGDVMDGIEGLIRKPYGCFEQTSSSTYPNIMVLKYLKEAGKSNPEIEKNAMNFIEEGYNRLIGFETSEGGFEWFGNTPPHETLTAYGVLEFVEMKEVYNNVSQKMINRTIKWLLSRRDGKGGFKKSKKGYDSFASSPKDVANAYIIYALSEAKVNENIELEYNLAYKKAVKRNDTYKMALLALTSFNLNKTTNAQTLINKIKENIENYSFSKLPVENTITRSYGNAKNLETVAFTLLALMKEDKPDEFLISEGIEYLVSKRKYNRFGSTQSTAMSLKALIEYTKIQKAKFITKNDNLEIIINGKKTNVKLENSKNGKIVIENIESYIKEGSQNIQVKFSNSENIFPYSLNINYDSYLPKSSIESPLKLETIIANKPYKIGDNVSMTINVSNKKNENLGMVTTIIGIPSGTTAQPWQLKEIVEQNKAAYYEIFDNYIVFYWRSFRTNETKTIRLDLKADIAGKYRAPASTAYLYYGDEFKTWISGNRIEIMD